MAENIEPVKDQGELHERLKRRFIDFHGFPDLNAHELADDMIYFFEDHGALAALPDGSLKADGARDE